MKTPTRTYHMHETGEIVSLLERTERLLAVIQQIDDLNRKQPAISKDQADRLIAALLEEQEKGAV